MSVRVQVILQEDEAARFRSQAMKESKSLSAWLRDAGKKMLDTDQQRQPLTDPTALKSFFQKCSEREKGTEPDWEEHKRLLLDGMRVEHRP
jgi:hypothetical protein